MGAGSTGSLGTTGGVSEVDGGADSVVVCGAGTGVKVLGPPTPNA